MICSTSIIARGTRRSGTAAFTLIELMTVMVIIVLLLGMLVGGWQYARRKAMISRAKADLQVISAALQNYRMEYKMSWRTASTVNTYPYPTVAGTDARLLGVTAITNFIPSGFTFLDPWGTNYIYEYSPSTAKEKYALWSHGGDPGNPADRINSGG